MGGFQPSTKATPKESKQISAEFSHKYYCHYSKRQRNRSCKAWLMTYLVFLSRKIRKYTFEWGFKCTCTIHCKLAKQDSCMYVASRCASLHVHRYMYTATCTSLHIHRLLYIATCTSLCVHRYMYIAACTSLHAHRCMYIATCTSICVHRYMYTTTWISLLYTAGCSLHVHRYMYTKASCK